MQKERLLVAVFVVLIIVGGVGSFFMGFLQRSLMVPMMMHAMTISLPSQPGMMKQSMTGQQGAKQKQGGGNNKKLNAVTPTPAPLLTTEVVAKDTFGRGNQPFWGRASDGEYWGGDANRLHDFSIKEGVGRVVAMHDTVNAVLGGMYADEQVVASGSINSFMLGETNFGVVLRWIDSNNWYKAYIDGSKFVLLKSVAGRQEELQAIPFATEGDRSYTMRFQVRGTQLAAKVWPSDQVEPQRWMLTANDTALMNGRAGMRFVMVPGVAITVTMFLAQELVNKKK